MVENRKSILVLIIKGHLESCGASRAERCVGCGTEHPNKYKNKLPNINDTYIVGTKYTSESNVLKHSLMYNILHALDPLYINLYHMYKCKNSQIQFSQRNIRGKKQIQ